MFGFEDERLPQHVKLETALGSYAFPTRIVEIGNYIGDYLEAMGKADLATNFQLGRFSMKLQALERTYIDKVFALCDYYLQGKSLRYSRHLYDIYKLTPAITFNDELVRLIQEIRTHRAKMSICPSAKDGVVVSDIILEFCNNNFYEEDYRAITSYFAFDYVSYEEVIQTMLTLAQKAIF